MNEQILKSHSQKRFFLLPKYLLQMSPDNKKNVNIVDKKPLTILTTDPENELPLSLSARQENYQKYIEDQLKQHQQNIVNKF